MFIYNYRCEDIFVFIYQRWEEEERAGVLGWPVAVAGLQGGEEGDGSAECGGGRFMGDGFIFTHLHLGYALFEILLMQELQCHIFFLILIKYSSRLIMVNTVLMSTIFHFL